MRYLSLLALLALSVAFPAQALTVKTTCKLGWNYPADQQDNIDGFRLYVDGVAKGTALPTAREMPCGTLAAGKRTLELTAYNAAEESAKSNALIVTVVTAAPPSPTGFKVTVTVTAP